MLAMGGGFFVVGFCGSIAPALLLQQPLPSLYVVQTWLNFWFQLALLGCGGRRLLGFFRRE